MHKYYIQPRGDKDGKLKVVDIDTNALYEKASNVKLKEGKGLSLHPVIIRHCNSMNSKTKENRTFFRETYDSDYVADKCKPRTHISYFFQFCFFYLTFAVNSVC